MFNNFCRGVIFVAIKPVKTAKKIAKIGHDARESPFNVANILYASSIMPFSEDIFISKSNEEKTTPSKPAQIEESKNHPITLAASFPPPP